MKSKNSKEEEVDEVLRQLDIQYTKMAMELEKVENLSQKIAKIDSKLRDIEALIQTHGIKFQPRTISTKTKETIIVILQKYGSLPAAQVGKILKLSRTRCNEYLKEMEEEGRLISESKSRKKYYKIRQ